MNNTLMHETPEQQARRRRLEHELIEQYMADQLVPDTEMKERYAAGYVGYTESRMSELLGLYRLQFRMLRSRMEQTEPLATLGPRLIHSLRAVTRHPEWTKALCAAINTGTTYNAEAYRGERPVTEEHIQHLLVALESYEQRDFVDEVLQECSETQGE